MEYFSKRRFSVCVVAIVMSMCAYLFFRRNGFQANTLGVRKWELFDAFLPKTHNVLEVESPSDVLAQSSQNNQSKWLRSFPENQLRLQHLQKMCSAHDSDFYMLDNNPKENMDFFLMDLHRQLLYCYIPKVASSTMKRVFNILAEKNHGQSLFNMSSRAIHRVRGSYTSMKFDMSRRGFLRNHLLFSTFTKILFVRDPYERIFSGYIDRMFGISDNLYNFFHLLKPHTPKNSCANANLTFRHVIDYVIRTSPTKMEQHYSPYYSTCFPCHLSYDYVGKMETFRPDVENILTSLGVDSHAVLGDDNKFDVSHELSILRDVSKRAFEMGRKKSYLRCFSKYRILKRYWVTFQVRGYLSINDTFPLSDKEAKKINSDQFSQLVKEAYLGVKNREAVRQQRGMAMREAYTSLPRPKLHKLQAVLQRDCDLFNYDCDVDRRFSESERVPPVFRLDKV